MRKWECIVCGLIYDEAKGWPDDGIAPGTRWEDVPEDWLCPDCGVGKEDFELLEEAAQDDAPHHETPGAEAQPAPVVIIGTGLAGYGIAREFRKHDSDTPLLLITEDDGRAYSKPMLSTGYTKNTDAEALTQSDAGTMGANLNASVWTMTRVQAVDTQRKVLRLADRETEVHYAALVFATGASVIRPPLGGDALERVYSVNDLMDYDDFRTAMQRLEVKRVAIIGGGLIGCEFTNDLLNGGFEIDVIDPLEHCLPTLLPEPCARALQRGLEEKGARFHFGPLVTEVNFPAGSTDYVQVSLSDGRMLDADIVVSAVGVRPNIELAKASGIAVNRGIVTDRHLKTSAADVYALGDCAEVDGHVLVYVAPLMAAARALGKTLAGEPTQVSYPAMPVTIKVPACPTVVAPPAVNADGEWTFTVDGMSTRGEYRNAAGELLGFALTGDATKEKMKLQKMLPPILA
ncbi:FAD-dependent oxidoreductase [Congregibacter variabilis]|uniref:FAD-dependent oxidoreductase n=1 Tax=Congregibacter variabilis TaxID=3081200 RepID=A0ABZ0I2T3_9GAMM|nr:FAD-dependent oxidoreductase [Congregibacter sp. IMCC43200]